MISPYQQSPTAQNNPLLARNIDETVNNLKLLEACIDQLRTDLVQVAEATGNIPAAQRLLTPTQLGASPFASVGGAAPWDPQRQMVSPLAQSAAASPTMGPYDPYETSFNPYAQAQAAYSPLVNPAAGYIHPSQAFTAGQSVNPWHQQAQLQMQRQVELERQIAFNPWAQASIIPGAHTTAPQAAFAAQRIPQSFVHQSPYALQAPFSAQRTPYAPSALLSQQTPQVPFAQQAPWAATQSPFVQQNPWAAQATIGQQASLRSPSSVVQNPSATARHFASPQVHPSAAIGPF